MKTRTAPFVFLVCACLTGISSGAIVYQDAGTVFVRGTWNRPAGILVSQADDHAVDLNQDGQPEVDFAHDFLRNPTGLSPQGVDIVGTAVAGISDILDHLHEATELVKAAAGADADGLMRAQQALDIRLNAIDAIAESTRYNQRGLLDGSSGFNGTSNTRNVTLTVSGAPLPGTYHVDVIQPGSTANVEALTDIRGQVHQDEQLSINGVGVQLFAGWDKNAIIHRINEFSPFTDVFATGSAFGNILLRQLTFGAEHSIEVVSNVAADHFSSGFGTTSMVDIGSDIIVRSDGEEIAGKGNRVFIDDGPAKGVSLAFSPIESPFVETGQEPASFTISDSSLSLLLETDPPQFIDLAIPSLKPAALANDMSSYPFSLADASVTSAGGIPATINVLAASIQEANQAKDDLDEFLVSHAAPLGNGLAQPERSVQFMMDGDQVAMLSVGDSVGPDADWGTKPLTTSFENEASERFLGVEFRIRDELHYGWIGIHIGEDGDFVIDDFAYNTSPSRSLIVGSVPEPCGFWWPLVALIALLRDRRVATG